MHPHTYSVASRQQPAAIHKQRTHTNDKTWNETRTRTTTDQQEKKTDENAAVSECLRASKYKMDKPATTATATAAILLLYTFRKRCASSGFSCCYCIYISSRFFFFCVRHRCGVVCGADSTAPPAIKTQTSTK